MIFSPCHIDIDFEKYRSADYDQHLGFCQLDELREFHGQYGGFPESYCPENTMMYQLWWTEKDIDYQDLGKQLGMEVITVSTIKQPPGCVVPYHKDTFFRIRQMFPDRTEPRVRANIFLEDYRLGHLLQYTLEHQHHASTKWQAGDGFLWDGDVLHLGANVGMQYKYTMQISGFLV
jgi:hypothetical protein